MTAEDAIETAASLGLTVKFDEHEVSERGGMGVTYDEVDGDRVKAFTTLVSLVAAGE